MIDINIDNVNGIITVSSPTSGITNTYFGRTGRSGKIYPNGDIFVIEIGGDYYEANWQNISVGNVIPTSQYNAWELLSNVVSNSPTPATPTLNITALVPEFFPAFINNVDPLDLASWNAALGGTSYTSVSITGNTASLSGVASLQSVRFNTTGANGFIVSISDSGTVGALYDDALFDSYSLISLNFSSVTTIGKYAIFECLNLTSINFPSATLIRDSAFYGCINLAEFIFPSLTSIESSAFALCASATNFYLPSCTDLGGSVGDNNVFLNIVNRPSISLTIPSALMTCNLGLPDGDISTLQQQNNTSLVINQV
jgi:hypothetical protein